MARQRPYEICGLANYHVCLNAAAPSHICLFGTFLDEAQTALSRRRHKWGLSRQCKVLVVPGRL